MNSELGFVHVYERGPSARTLLLLHGTGGSEHELLSLGKQLDPAASLLSFCGSVLILVVLTIVTWLWLGGKEAPRIAGR